MSWGGLYARRAGEFTDDCGRLAFERKQNGLLKMLYTIYLFFIKNTVYTKLIKNVSDHF